MSRVQTTEYREDTEWDAAIEPRLRIMMKSIG